MKHIAKRRIKNTAQLLAVLGLVGMSTFGLSAHAQDVDNASKTSSHYDGTHTGTDHKIKPNLTDAQKEVLKQAKDLRKAGKKDEAKALLEKVGIKKPMMKHHHTQSQPKNTTQ
jgi:hypothetical protein